MKRSLSIGINDYPNTGNDLSGCVNDAMDWLQALGKRGFLEQATLFDKQATKQAMVDAMTKIVEATTSKDLAVITFSGHGTWVPDADGDEADGRDEALCPWDIGTTGAVLTDDELYAIFSNRHRGARIVFISDSCHSGSVSRAAFAPTVDDDWKFSRMRFLAPEIHLSGDQVAAAKRVEKAQIKSKIRAATVLFAGCQDTEYSYDAWFNKRPNGAFTYMALKALEQNPQNYGAWYQLIRQRLPHVQYPQTPQIHCAKYQRAWKTFQE